MFFNELLQLIKGLDLITLFQTSMINYKIKLVKKFLDNGIIKILSEVLKELMVKEGKEKQVEMQIVL